MTSNQIEIKADLSVVLITDRLEDILSTQHMLAKVGLKNTHGYTSVREGIEACRELHPSVLVVDSELAGMSATRFVEAVKNDEHIPNMGVIITCRRQPVIDPSWLAEYGIAGLLVSPFSAKELMDMLTKACAQLSTTGGLEYRYSEAKQAYLERNSEGAIRGYQGLYRDTSSERSSIGLAQSYEQDGQTERGLQTLSTVTDGKTAKLRLMQMRLAFQLAHGDLNDQFMAAVQSCGEDPVALMELHKTAVGYRRYDLAVVACKAAIRTGLNDEDMHLNLAKAQLNDGQIETAVLTLKHITETFGESLSVLGLQARVYREQAHHKLALDSYLKALRLNPSDPRILFNVGLSHLDLQNFEKARVYFQQCLKESPNFILAKQKLAELDRITEE